MCILTIHDQDLIIMYKHPVFQWAMMKTQCEPCRLNHQIKSLFHGFHQLSLHSPHFDQAYSFYYCSFKKLDTLTLAPLGPGNPITPGCPRAPWGPGGPGRPSSPAAPCQKTQGKIPNQHCEPIDREISLCSWQLRLHAKNDDYISMQKYVCSCSFGHEIAVCAHGCHFRLCVWWKSKYMCCSHGNRI